jgi:hypothetical protein
MRDTKLRAQVGPDTWVQLDVDGPFGIDELGMLNEFLRIMVRGYARAHTPDDTARPATTAGDGSEDR